MGYRWLATNAKVKLTINFPALYQEFMYMLKVQTRLWTKCMNKYTTGDDIKTNTTQTMGGITGHKPVPCSVYNLLCCRVKNINLNGLTVINLQVDMQYMTT